MKRLIAGVRGLTLALLGTFLLAGCASIPSADVQTFSTGVSAAKSQTDTAFQGVTDLASEAMVDYAAAQPTLNDSNFLPILDAQSIATWDEVFSALQKYSQNLILLTSPDLTKDYQDAVVNLATQVKQAGDEMKGQQMAASVPSPSLAAAFTELGSLLLSAKAQHDARGVLLQADPTVRTVFTTMADAIGSTTNNLRGTVRAHWEQRKAKLKLAFLEAKPADRRAIATQYASLLNGETTQDLALASLQRSYLALADAHHALANGRNADVTAAVAVVEREVQNTANLANRFKAIEK
jgi:hypothetical protein